MLGLLSASFSTATRMGRSHPEPADPRDLLPSRDWAAPPHWYRQDEDYARDPRLR